jgi:hypothetical protein
MFYYTIFVELTFLIILLYDFCIKIHINWASWNQHLATYNEFLYKIFRFYINLKIPKFTKKTSKQEGVFGHFVLAKKVFLF